MLVSAEFNLHFTYSDLFSYSKLLAEKMGVPLVNDEVIYPNEIAEGYTKVFEINNCLSYMISHYTAKQRMQFDHLPSQENNLTIAFRNYSLVKKNSTDEDSDSFVINENKLGSVQCKCTRVAEQFILEPGEEVKLILILMKEGWLQNILHDSQSKEKISRYLLNQSACINLRKEFLNPEQFKLFTKLFSDRGSFLTTHLFFESQVLSLLESFLEEVISKEDQECRFLFASHKDIIMLQKAECFINDNLTNPFPGVEALCRISCMSRTKFINLFQKVYGMSSFEYSQKKRLSIAYEYLKAGKKCVSDTAQLIGYASANNFALAFKKEFGLLPRELLEKGSGLLGD